MDERRPGHFDDVIATAVADAKARGERPGKIPVIKVLREKTGVDLKAAKDAVEEYGRRNGVSELARPASLPIGGAAAIVAGVAVLVLLGWVSNLAAAGDLPRWAVYALPVGFAGVLVAVWIWMARASGPGPKP
jgi:hypothetical protein